MPIYCYKHVAVNSCRNKRTAELGVVGRKICSTSAKRNTKGRSHENHVRIILDLAHLLQFWPLKWQNARQTMRIGVIGLWHLGGVYSACLADLGNSVVGIDGSLNIINKLNKGIAPLKEPKLEETIQKN